MNNEYRFYDLSTGVVQPGSMLLPNAESVLVHTPEGHAPTQIEIDPKTQRFDPETMEIVPYEPPPLPLEVVEQEARMRRDGLLDEADRWVQRELERSLLEGGAVTVPRGILVYKEALRALPDSEGWPRSITWPTKPAT